MTTIVFTGPTLPPDEVRRECDAVCLPPVSQGDVYRAAQRRPRAIGIIDGYFRGAPSVWHKEILYALSQSIPVFGSASMGALRAAELHGFGMRGVGRIFEAYRDGELEDDDEVAVIHGPPETGFVAISEALVNIRATLAKAQAEQILTPGSRDILEAFAKSLFFHQRDWPSLLEAGLARGVGRSEIEALGIWLPGGRVDQKREDAIAMLRAMRATDDRPTPTPPFRFEWTHFWDELVARDAANPPRTEDAASADSEPILDELRLSGAEAFKAVKVRALLRLIGEARSVRAGQVTGSEALQAALSRLRSELGLFSRAKLDAWLTRNGLDEASLEKLLRGRMHVDKMMEARGASLAAAMLDELRLTGAYEALAVRARDKRLALKELGNKGLTIRPSGADALLARLWFIESRLRRSPDEDVGAIAQELGFRDLAHFDEVLREEQIYSKLQFPHPG
ncbi:hypothetical protein SAMN05444161_7787 [Rhizobiales bacterium GAS191]|nr:hypothetical protein SAMN05444161_7787 [Rhizobiales bacterium GAS191]